MGLTVHTSYARIQINSWRLKCIIHERKGVPQRPRFYRGRSKANGRYLSLIVSICVLCSGTPATSGIVCCAEIERHCFDQVNTADVHESEMERESLLKMSNAEMFVLK